MPVSPSDNHTSLLRAQLSAPPGDDRSGWQLRENRTENVLIAVTLHAAARRELGLKLTELELQLTDQLAALFDEATMEEFGRIYREPNSQSGIIELFPDLVTQRPLGAGVGIEQLSEWLESAEKEITALPTVRSLTVHELVAGGLNGTEEVVVVTAPPTKGTDSEVDTGHEVRIRLVRSRCDRAPHGAVRDEIHWGAGAGSDLYAQTVTLTPQLDSVQSGSSNSFAHNTHFFKGPAQEFVVGHIRCWESSPGSQSHRVEMRRGLTDVARHGAVIASQLNRSGEGSHIGLMVGMARLISWLFVLDGKNAIAEKTIAFSRDALVHLARNGDGRSKMVFDASALERHTLTLETTFAPKKSHTIKHSTYYAGSWSTPVPVSDTANVACPSMTVHNGTLYMTSLTACNSVHLFSYDGEHWSHPRPVMTASSGQRVRSSHSPAIVSFEGALLMVWNVPNTTVRVTQELDPIAAHLHGRQTSQQTSADHLSLLAHDGQLFSIASKGTPRDAWCILDRYDSSTGFWSQTTRIAISQSPPAAVSLRGRIWVFYRAMNDELAVVSSSNGERWCAETGLPGLGTVLAPAAATFHTGPRDIRPERLVAAWRFKDSGKLLYSFYEDGTPWRHVGKVDNSRDHLGSAIQEHEGSLQMLLW